jgi:Fe-S cluster assembly iron-binding protein IscA
MMMEKKSEPDLRLRLAVDSGGCSGFQYVFELESTPVDEEEDM